MTDRPIIFSGPMVRALLDGRKTQTRRLAWLVGDYPNPAGKVEVLYIGDGGFPVWRRPTIWQKVKPGDRLIVRENIREANDNYYYCADDQGVGTEVYRRLRDLGYPRRVRPNIHMPRWASRLTLLVTEARMQRVQEIDGIDALAEGITPVEGLAPWRVFKRNVWDVIHKPGNQWADNPEVVALTFEVGLWNIDWLEAA